MTPKEQDAALRMIQPTVEASVKAHFRHVSEADRPAIVNIVLLGLWRQVLPKYNPARGLLQNYLAACSRRLVLNELHKSMTGKNKKVKLNQRRRRKLTTAVKDYEARSFDGDATDKLAAELTIAPEGKLSPVQASNLRDYVAAGNIDALGRLWNCTRAAADQKLTRLRRAIKAAAGDSSDQRGFAQLNAA